MYSEGSDVVKQSNATAFTYFKKAAERVNFPFFTFDIFTNLKPSHYSRIFDQNSRRSEVLLVHIDLICFWSPHWLSGQGAHFLLEKPGFNSQWITTGILYAVLYAFILDCFYIQL